MKKMSNSEVMIVPFLVVLAFATWLVSWTLASMTPALERLDVSAATTVTGVGHCMPGIPMITVVVPVDCEAVCGVGSKE